MKKNKIKILAVFSNIDYAKEFYWYAKYINHKVFDLVFVFLNPKKAPIEAQISSLGYKVVHFNFKGKKDILLSIIKLSLLIIKERPAIIHSQLFEATLISNIAAFLTLTKNRIITRHHSDYHHKYFPAAVKYDKLINFLSTRIVIPSSTLISILEKEKCNPGKIEVIYHGFDFNEFHRTNEEVKIIKQKYGITGYPVIGIISRFTHWKGLQYSIPAFSRLLDFYPDALLVLANAYGEYKNEVITLLNKLPDHNYRLIEFEEDNYSLLRTFDVFVHTPISKTAESFGQVYIEALYLQIPSVITLSGIAYEVPLFKKYAYVVDYENIDQILEGIIKILSSYKDYKEKLIKAKFEIEEIFGFNKKIQKLENLYFNLCKIN